MPSQNRSLKLPGDLAEVANLRAQQLGYPSWNAYVKGLIRYDAMVQGTHDITQPMASLPLDQQERIDSKLLTNTQQGTGERGQYLKRLLGRTEKIKKPTKEPLAPPDQQT